MSTELVDRFENPSVRFGPVPLWWWSGDRLERDRLRWQMEQLLAQGVHQAVVMNLAPTGPLYGALADDPPFMSEEWWEIFAGVCADAEERGFQIWLYDQIGFSGANLQGKIVAADPRHAGRSLTQLRSDASAGDARLTVPADGEPLAAWFAPSDGSPVVPVTLEGAVARCDRGDGELVVCFAAIRGFDYFSPEAGAALIDTVFGEYERRVGRTFGRGIGGVFQDELPDVPTWSPGFEEGFRRLAGYDLIPRLPALWGDRIPDEVGIDGDRVRLDYHRVRAGLAREAFFDPLAAWLERAGLPCGFDQQSPAREGEPIGATEHYADYLQTHSTYAIPGSDHWGDPKLHSSLAHAHGHQRVWIEAFHSSGWGGTLEETYDWLSPYFRRGANLYDPHAVYYSTRSGWFEWAPPSTCWRQPYWPDYHRFAQAVTRLSSVLTTGRHVASTVLLFPTEFVQSRLTADGRDLGARAAESSYFALNGSTAWYAERRGILERAGVDYDILGAYSLHDARVENGELRLGDERYRNVVLPAIELLDARTALLLADLAQQGGRVVCVRTVPDRFESTPAEAEDEDLAAAAADAFRAVVAEGLVPRVDDDADVPAVLLSSAVAVTADAPVLHRLAGETHLIAAIAHDERSGTVQPLLPDFGSMWHEGDFNWKGYWQRLSTEGYSLVPPAGRPLTVRLESLTRNDLEAQLWDPRTGLRRAVEVRRPAPGIVEVSADFSAGAFALLAIGPELPPATESPAGALKNSAELDGDWEVQAESTLDNRWADVDARDRPGIVPVQVWRFDSRIEGADGSSPVIATFGPFAEVTDADGRWRPAEWSLSRGIRNDPIHDESLGPNGYVPEEFVQWRDLRAGETRRLRTTLTVPAEAPVLAVGGNGPRSIRFDGEELPAAAAAYLSFSPLPAGRTGELEIEFTAVQEGDLRAYFALTGQPDRFARPEWIETADAPSRSTTVSFSTRFAVDGDLADARVQLSSEGPSLLFVNGREVGRQGDFDPYAGRRFTRVHPYDLRDVLNDGENTLEVRSTDLGRPVAIRLDSVPSELGGLGLSTDATWTVTREGSPVSVRQRYQQYEDPRYGCLVPRAHPLQAATWLEPEARDASVATIVPDLRPGEQRTEVLGFVLPIGATQLTVPTVVPFTAVGGGVSANARTVTLAEPARAGQRLELRFTPSDGRRGGALLDGPVTAVCESAPAPLVGWADLGLGALGGAVHYRRALPAGPTGARTVLDLGRVRGTAEVRVDGKLIDILFTGPWRVELTEALAGHGDHHLEVTVRGTLAPYLDVASPTSAVMAGQTVHGLFGPVVLETRSSS